MPMNQVCEASAGETVLEVALNHDIPIQHACGGFCACTTCHLQVKQGAENLEPMGDEEEERMDRATGMTPQSRLACQSKIRGDVVVEVVNLE
ncbi:MAG: 2Fe-2S iron-sulfur cluster-binding protein [Bacteriovoracia bacterium]